MLGEMDDDTLASGSRNEGDEPFAWAEAQLDELARGRVLDVGCGEGRFLREGWVGVDVDAARLAFARLRSGRVVRADAHALPLHVAAFDTALAFRMLDDAGDIDRVLAEVARVLRPGGALLVLTRSPARPPQLRRIHDEARAALGLGVPRADRLHEGNGAARLGRFFRAVDSRTRAWSWHFDDPAAALDHYARRYLHRGRVGAAEAAALFDRVRERVVAAGAVDDEDRLTLFVARGPAR